jgi:AraC-like DNA-binding protein
MTVQLVGPASWPRLPWAEERVGASGRLKPSLQRLDPDARASRSHSTDASLILMVDGMVVLSSYRGRERLERGALAILPTFGAHALRAGPGGAAWLELPWRTDWSLGATLDVADVDRLLLLTAYDVTVALAEIERIMEGAQIRPSTRLHWIDDLRAAMIADPHLNISGWAKASRVSREGAARAFRAAYDVSPARFRLELRARNAWARIVSGADPLSLIALETGFADQAHMTRSVGWLTGKSPSAWRRRP